MINDVWLNRGLGLLLLVTVIYTLWLGQLGWNHTIMEEHSFRQTQTALTARSLMEGHSVFSYEMPLLGKPWALPLEFPIYQWSAVKVHQWFGVPLEQAGRYVARASFYLALIPIFLLLQAIGISIRGRIVAAILFLLSPIYLYWSRTMMIEMTAMMLSLYYAGFSAKAFQKNSKLWLGFAAFAGIFGALIKATTFATFGVLVFALFVYFRKQLFGWKIKEWLDRSAIVQLAFTCAIPLVFGIIWARYTENVRALNPLAEGFITGEYFFNWNFGGLDLRLNGDFWNNIFRRSLHDAIGHRTTFMISLLLMAWQRRYWRFYVLFLGLFLFSPLLFANLHFVHNYYLCANAIFLIIALAITVVTFLDKRDFRRYIGIIFFIFASFYAVRDYHKVAYHLQKADRGDLSASGDALDKFLPPGDIILVYGADWIPTYTYYSRRKSIMNRWPKPITDPQMQAALRNLGETKIGAILFCNESANNTDLIFSVTSHLKFQGQPTKKLALQMCPTYLPEVANQ